MQGFKLALQQREFNLCNNDMGTKALVKSVWYMYVQVIVYFC